MTQEVERLAWALFRECFAFSKGMKSVLCLEEVERLGVDVMSMVCWIARGMLSETRRVLDNFGVPTSGRKQKKAHPLLDRLKTSFIGCFRPKAFSFCSRHNPVFLLDRKGL